MTLAAEHNVHLSASLQSLIDSRLDTIDRMLLGRVGRAERMSIVREVESQIHELLAERNADEPSREDVLAVLGRLDPPEAFLGDEFERDEPATVRPAVRAPSRLARAGNERAARVSGILGLVALGCLLLVPLSYVLAIFFESVDTVVMLGLAVTSMCMFICSVVAIATGFFAQERGVGAGRVGHGDSGAAVFDGDRRCNGDVGVMKGPDHKAGMSLSVRFRLRRMIEKSRRSSVKMVRMPSRSAR